MANRTVSVALRAEVAGFVSGMRTAKQATSDFKTELSQAAKRGDLDAVASSAAGMGLALAGAFGYAVKAAADFDKQMSEVGAVSNASAGQMDLLRGAALRAGKETSFSATEAAKAQAELAKAGLSSADILGGALSGALSLAAAGGLDLAEAADISAKAMNVFKLRGADVGHIADVLAASANKSATDVHEMGEALKQGGLVAADTGLTLEDTVGTLSAFADRALVGSDAGTSLKTMLQMLANPSKEAAAKMRELGINAYDAQGKFVGVTSLAGQLQTKLGGLTQAERDAATATIFGSDAKRAALVLYNLGEKGLRDYVSAVDDEGAAADVARKKTDNLSGDVERLTGSLETLAIESGSSANGGLRFLAQAADSLVSNFAAAPPAIGSTVTVMAGLSGAGLLAFAAFIKLRGSTANALGELAKMGPTGEKTAKGLGTAAKWGGRAAAALTAVQVASAMMSDNVNPQIDALANSLVKYGKTGEKAGEATRVLGDDFSHLAFDLGTLDSGFWTDLGNGVSGFVEGLTGMGGVMDESLQHAKERLGAIDSALAQLVQGGRSDDAAAAFKRLADEAARHGVSIDELKKGLPQYAAALDGAKESTDKQAKAEEVASDNAKTMSGSLQEAVEKAGSLKDAFDNLNGKTMTWAETEMDAEAAVDDLTESMSKNGLTMDVNTEQGRANKEALLSGIKAARDAAQAKYDETGSLEQANAVYGQYRQKLEDTIATQGGTVKATDATREAAKKLVEQFGAFPKLVQTPVTAPGLSKTRADLAEYSRGLDRVDDRVVNTYANHYVNTYVRYYDDGRSNRGNSRYGANDYAKGGIRRAQLGMIIPPSDPGTILTAEPETGGEALIPLRGISRGRAAMLGKTALGGYGLDVVPRDQRWHGGQAVTPAMLAALAGSGKGPGGGLNVEHLEVKAYSDRFSLSQVQGELYMHGAH